MAWLWEHKARSGRPRAIPAWAEAALQKRLQEVQGFDGYQGCDWLESQLGIEAADKTVHQLVHYRLQSAPLRSPLYECRAVVRAIGGI